MNRYRFTYLSCFLTILSFSAQANGLWHRLSGNWLFDKQDIISYSPENTNHQGILFYADTQKGEPWISLKTDFKYASEPEARPIGIILNATDINDYHLLKITPDSQSVKVSLLHWKFNQERICSEFICNITIEQDIWYTLSIEPAPGVDYEDWRPWKIVLKEKDNGKNLLKLPAENLMSFFGNGQVGLLVENANVSFSSFTAQKDISQQQNNHSLQLAPIFRDKMVLQRNRSLPVWGKSKPLDKIEIGILSKKYNGYSDKNGNWTIVLDPMDVQRNISMIVRNSEQTIQLNDIAIGEVWIASGQSNMEMRTWQSDVSSRIYKSSDDRDLRLFLQPKWPSDEPIFTSGGEWIEADSANIMGWSAVAYTFASGLRENLDIPVGIIAAYWGGTKVESWFPREELDSSPFTRPILNRYKRALCILKKASKVENIPVCNGDVPWQHQAAGNLFNGMIYPHIPYAVQGVIWYQGESNTIRSKQYGYLFPMLINYWRKAWNNPDLNFLYVQLPGYSGADITTKIESAWSQLRDIQRKVTDSIENTGMAIAFDLGDSLDIHPYRKYEVAQRLLRLALHDVYNKQEIVRSGPLLTDAVFSKKKVILHFRETANGLTTIDGNEPGGFIIAGSDRKFYKATVRIMKDGKTVEVSSKDVYSPSAVRYGWKNYPIESNMANSEQLPMSPFRTDSWELPADDDL